MCPVFFKAMIPGGGGVVTVVTANDADSASQIRLRDGLVIAVKEGGGALERKRLLRVGIKGAPDLT